MGFKKKPETVESEGGDKMEPPKTWTEKKKAETKELIPVVMRRHFQGINPGEVGGFTEPIARGLLRTGNAVLPKDSKHKAILDSPENKTKG